jgi:hypothetical protein
MVISRDSWHYKVAKFWFKWDDEAPKSLCPYFWSVIGGAAKAIFFSLIAVTFVAVILGLIYILFSPFFISEEIHQTVISVLWWLVFGVAAYRLGLEYVEDNEDSFLAKEINPPMVRLPSIPKPRPPSFVKICFEYLKAAKQKVCPMVEFK